MGFSCRLLTHHGCWLPTAARFLGEWLLCHICFWQLEYNWLDLLSQLGSQEPPLLQQSPALHKPLVLPALLLSLNLQGLTVSLRWEARLGFGLGTAQVPLGIVVLQEPALGLLLPQPAGLHWPQDTWCLPLASRHPAKASQGNRLVSAWATRRHLTPVPSPRGTPELLCYGHGASLTHSSHMAWGTPTASGGETGGTATGTPQPSPALGAGSALSSLKHPHGERDHCSEPCPTPLPQTHLGPAPRRLHVSIPELAVAMAATCPGKSRAPPRPEPPHWLPGRADLHKGRGGAFFPGNSGRVFGARPALGPAGTAPCLRLVAGVSQGGRGCWGPLGSSRGRLHLRAQAEGSEGQRADGAGLLCSAQGLPPGLSLALGLAGRMPVWL